MLKSKMTSKGQLTVPKEVRKRMGLRPGDEIEFIEDKSGFRLRRYFVESPFDQYVDYLKHLAGRDPDELVREMRGD